MARASFLRHPSYPAKIDPSHPIGRKVTACISPHYGAPHVRPMEMIRGEPSTIAAGAINGIAAGPVGKAFRASTTSSGVYWPTRPAFCDMSGPFSVEILFTFLAADAQFSRLFDHGAAGGVGTLGGWDFEIDGTGSGLTVVTWNGGANNAAQTLVSGMTAGRTYHVVWTGAGGAATTSSIYLNTVLTGVTTGTSTTFGGNNFFFNSYRTVGDLSTAGIALHIARFYQGYQLTPNEVGRLYTRPFEMFRKLRRSPVNSVAAATSTPWQALVQDNQPLPDTRMAVAI